MTETEEPKTEVKFAPPDEALLRELGMVGAADGLKSGKELARKLKVAFEHYQVIKPEQLAAFQEKLKKNSFKRDGYIETFQYLAFTPLANYGKIPPQEILLKVKEAKERACFDSFEVATIETNRADKTPVPDPIIFGCIAGSGMKFPVAQWDEDIKIEDIIGAEEGWPVG